MNNPPLKYRFVIFALLVPLFIILSTSDAYGNEPRYGQVIVNVSPTGHGKVYASTQNATPDDNDYVAGASSAENGAERFIVNPTLTFYIFAKADPGYTLTGWNTDNSSTATKSEGTDNPKKISFTASSDNIDSPTTKYYYAVFNEKEYTITYQPNGGSGGNSPTKYNISSTATLPAATYSGNTFIGWKVTNANSESNWNDGEVYPAGTSLNGKYGNITLSAQWDRSLCINVNGLDSGEQAIFSVSGEGKTYTINMGNGTQKIKNVTQGQSYTVTPTGWSYGYTVSNSSLTQNINGKTDFNFTFTPKQNRKKHAESSTAR